MRQGKPELRRAGRVRARLLVPTVSFDSTLGICPKQQKPTFEE
jgi:hypothetical protein